MLPAHDGLARAERGFTLLEVLIAFIIAALAMSELFSVAAGDLRATRVAGRYEAALSRAQSHLAAIGLEERLVAGEQQGDDGGGYHYASRVALVAAAPPTAGGGLLSVQAPPRAALYVVNVAISWQEGERARVVRLTTERVGQAPPSSP